MENIYFIASSLIVVIVSLCSGYYLKVNKIFSIFTVFIIGISSLILSVAFPFIYLRFNLTYTVICLGAAVIFLCLIIAFFEWKIFIPYLESIERRYQKLNRLSNQVVSCDQPYNQIENSTEPINHVLQTDISKQQHVPDPDVIDVNEIIQNIGVEDTIDWNKIGSQDSTLESIAPEQIDDILVKEKTVEDKLVPEQPLSYQDIFLSNQFEEDEDSDIQEVIDQLTSLPDNDNQQDKTHPRLEFPKKSE